MSLSLSPSRSLTRLLKSATAPIGRTLYVWGGGWNEADDGAGTDARTIGISPRWCEFYEQAGVPDYDFNRFRHRIHDGLDCSGYVGWAVYNALHDENGRRGYVAPSTRLAATLAEHGLGTLLPPERTIFSLPSDIVSMQGHVYLSLGCCADGTVLFLHASPPCLSLCGTERTPGIGMASDLARAVMARVYPTCTAVFPYRGRDHIAYTEDTSVFRFDPNILPDPDHLRTLSPKEIIAHLFPT